MPGRKQPRASENERDREYRMHEKREGGTKVQGEEGAFLDEMGGHGEVERERAREE
ncbi:MAG TPA: hypothetical protein VHH36_02260 [Candidatus Thermoplasmatota archaeon]|nr:hypothetical protein [Candidatus Thermoplasmatota archaeon]